MKKTNKRRKEIYIFIVLITIFFILLSLSKTTLSHQEKTYTTILVLEGDTLWKIASSNQENNRYYKNKDVRYIIDDLVKINNLQSKDLLVNQTLQIPTL